MFISVKKASVKTKFFIFNSVIGVFLLLAIGISLSLLAQQNKTWQRFESNTLKKFELIVSLSKENAFIKSNSLEDLTKLKSYIKQYRSLPELDAQESRLLSTMKKNISSNSDLDDVRAWEADIDALEKLAMQDFERKKNEYKKVINQGHLFLIFTLMGVMIVSTIIGAKFGKYFVRSIDQLKEGAKTIRNKDFATPVQISAEDELGELGNEMNYMRQSLYENFQQLERSNKNLEQFAYVTSHDLQEPLRKVISFGERAIKRSLENSNLDDQTRMDLERMVSASLRMRNLIDDLLSYSRLDIKENGLRELNVNKIIMEVLGDLEILVSEKYATISQDPFPPVKADPVLLRQLFQNLIGNSLKFSNSTEPPKVEITGKDLGNRVLIEVKDNGIGFQQKYADRILMPFQRLHSRQAFAGTGIGLAICNRIVESHGGALKVFSEPDKGASFIFDLEKA